MSSKRDLPPDTWTGILCRLPVKSLLRFRCVSKPWQSLIEDPGFARLHLNTFKDNCDETRLLVVEGWRHNCVVRCSVTFALESETLLALEQDYMIDWWCILNSIDGLVLLKRWKTDPFEVCKDLKVWNPSIRKFRELPSLPQMEKCSWDCDIGLGYDPSAKDYKLVKLIREGYTLRSAAVYSLGTGSWKIIPFQGEGYSWQCPTITESKKTVCLQGSLYFIALDAVHVYGSYLVSYDLSSEAFWSKRIPVGVEYLNCQLMLVDGGCSLAVFNGVWRGLAYDDKYMWVLESSGDESESTRWTRRYSFRLSNVERIMHVNKNGVILADRAVLLADPETEELKIVQVAEGASYSFYDAYAYVESLNLLK